MEAFWTTFFFKQLIYIFTVKSSFKTWFVVGMVRFQKCFDVDVLGFQIYLRGWYLGHFSVIFSHFVVIYGPFWPFMALFGPLWPFWALFGPFWPFLPFLALFGPIWLSDKM